MSIRELIHKLGGPKVVGPEINVAPKTISMWGSRDEIPPAFVITVWRLAKRKGVDWSPEGTSGLDLVEVPQ